MVYRYLFEAFPQSVTFSVYLYIYLGLQCLSVQPRSSGGLWASPGGGFCVTEHGIRAHGLSCPTVCGIFPNQGSNPCPLHWQADS